MKRLLLNEIIELMDKVTVNINSVEVRLIRDAELNNQFTARASKLWQDAYNLKKELSKALSNDNIQNPE